MSIVSKIDLKGKVLDIADMNARENIIELKTMSDVHDTAIDSIRIKNNEQDHFIRNMQEDIDVLENDVSDLKSNSVEKVFIQVLNGSPVCNKSFDYLFNCINDRKNLMFEYNGMLHSCYGFAPDYYGNDAVYVEFVELKDDNSFMTHHNSIKHFFLIYPDSVEYSTFDIPMGSGDGSVDLSDYYTKDEVNQQMQQIGDLSNLETIDKSNIVNALNEVFQSASSGKGLIATAITGKGVDASINDTFGQLASKITSLNVVGALATYSITNNLSNCINSNTDTTIQENSSYVANITANEGYELSDIVVTMGDSNIDVIDGNISIENVTGNIVITATATLILSKNYSFVVMSDIHIPSDETEDTTYGTKYKGITKFTNVLNTLQTDDCEFICTTGDLTTYADASQYTVYKNIVDSQNKTIYTCNGNHDLSNTSSNQANWSSYIGTNFNHIVERGNDVFIFMSRNGAGTTGDTPFGAETLDWLEQQLELHSQKRIFLFMHEPLTGYAGLKTNEIYGFSATSTEDERILGLLKSHLNVHCFSGHTHYVFELQETYSNINVHKLDYYNVSLIHVPSLTQPRNASGNITDINVSSQYLQCYKVDVYDAKIVLKAMNLANNQVVYEYEINTNVDWTEANRIVTSSYNIALNEGTTSNEITIGLEKSPSENITVNIASNSEFVTPSKASVTFTPTSYSTTLSVSAVDDGTTADYTCLLHLISDSVASVDINIAVTNTTVEIPQDGIPRYDISQYATGSACIGIPLFKHDDYENYPYVYLNRNTAINGEVYITTDKIYNINTSQRHWGSFKRYRWDVTQGWYQYKEGSATTVQPLVTSSTMQHSNVDIENANYTGNQIVPDGTIYLTADLVAINQ